MRIKLIAVC